MNNFLNRLLGTPGQSALSASVFIGLFKLSGLVQCGWLAVLLPLLFTVLSAIIVFIISMLAALAIDIYDRLSPMIDDLVDVLMELAENDDEEQDYSEPVEIVFNGRFVELPNANLSFEKIAELAGFNPALVSHMDATGSMGNFTLRDDSYLVVSDGIVITSNTPAPTANTLVCRTGADNIACTGWAFCSYTPTVVPWIDPLIEVAEFAAAMPAPAPIGLGKISLTLTDVISFDGPEIYGSQALNGKTGMIVERSSICLDSGMYRTKYDVLVDDTSTVVLYGFDDSETIFPYEVFVNGQRTLVYRHTLSFDDVSFLCDCPAAAGTSIMFYDGRLAGEGILNRHAKVPLSDGMVFAAAVTSNA